MSEDEIVRLMDATRFERAMAAASPEVQAWCTHFRNGGARSAQPRLDELAGELLSWQAPARLRDPHPAPADADAAMTGE